MCVYEGGGGGGEKKDLDSDCVWFVYVCVCHTNVSSYSIVTFTASSWLLLAKCLACRVL